MMNEGGKSTENTLRPVSNPKYELPDFSVGDAGRPDPLEQYSWPRLRSIIYGESGRHWSGYNPSPATQTASTARALC